MSLLRLLGVLGLFYFAHTFACLHVHAIRPIKKVDQTQYAECFYEKELD